MDHINKRNVANLIFYIGINRLVSGNNCYFVDNGFGSYGACNDYFYDEGFGTLQHCHESCKINYWCQGVAYSASTRICRRFTCSETKIVNEDFIFYSIYHCTDTRIEKHRAKHCVFKRPQPGHEGECSTGTSIIASQSVCKDLCYITKTCRGFTYVTSRNKCMQHDCPFSEKDGGSSSIYVRKLCGYSACQYVEIGGNKGASKTQINNLEKCISVCDGDDSCQGFELGSGSAASESTVCTNHNSSVTELSGLGSRALYKKECPGITDNPCKWTSHGNGTIGDCLFYDVIYGTLESCLAVCDSEEWCMGISYSVELHMSYLFPCNNSVRQDETMQFYSISCPVQIMSSDASNLESTTTHDDFLIESEVMTSLSTTQTVKTTGSKTKDSFSIPVSTTTASATHITYNNTVLCLCKCLKSSDETYPQFYSRIIKPLKIDKKQLSSYIRKRNSANDDRKSAAYFGYGGIFVLVTAIVIIVLADFSVLCKKINKLLKKASM